MTLTLRFLRILLMGLLIVSTNLVNICLAQNTKANTKTVSTKKEAERIWELAVKAQGGREKMNTIENLLISSAENFKSNQVKEYTNLYKKFYVFPNKMWEWEDHRPSVLGLTMRMYNWETGKKYIADPRQKVAELIPIEQIDIDRLKDMNGNVAWTGLAIYILESKWWKPIPEALRFGKINGQNVDIIQTTLNGKNVEFFFNQKSHLPVRISFYNLNKFTKNTDVNSVDVSNYVEVNGFIMPTKLKESDETEYNLTYQFNVAYNDDIFITPPLTGDFAVDAWKKR